MKHFFESIEKKIQTIVESSVHLAPGQSNNDFLFTLIKQLKEQLTAVIKNGADLPNIYSIRVNGEDARRINQENDWLEQIKNSLISIAADHGRSFLGPLSIELIPDDELRKKTFKISSYVVPSIIEQTAALKIAAKSDAPLSTFKREAFLILPDQRIFPLDRGIVQIGRRNDNNLIIDYPTISRNHAQIRCIQGKFVIFDLNSTSGTFVNGIKVSQIALYPGDVITLAGYAMIYGEEGTGAIKNHEKTSELPRTVDPS
jgi:hypothetical protein